MVNRDFLDALSLSAAFTVLAGCGGSQPPVMAPGIYAQGSESVPQAVPALAAREREPLLAVTRKTDGNPEPSYTDRVVKVREYKLPDKQVATDSIIVGPNHNLWFTEWRAIARLTANGQIRVTMNIPKVLCISLLTMMGSSLVCGVTLAGQKWPSEFSDQATTILGQLLFAAKKNPTGVRISYGAPCDAVRAAPLIPPIRLQKAPHSNTVLEAARIVFRGDDNVAVSRNEQGNVRIDIGNPPEALLRTNIATLRLDELEQYNPFEAIAAIEATKEVRKAAAALHLKPTMVIMATLVRQPAPGAPRLPSILQNLTVDQILDILAARFKGAIFYGVCTQGPQPRQFLIEFLDNDEGS